jgi:type III secretion protein C
MFMESKLKICCLVSLLLLAYTPGVPAGYQQMNQNVSLYAREQNIAQFLQELFGQIGLPVVVDDAVQGNVNGTFVDVPASEVFKNISRSFGLVKYYDGAVVYVYTSNSMTRKIIPVSIATSRKIINAAHSLSLTDYINNLKTSTNGALVVTGTKRFIQQVEELVYAAKNNLPDDVLPVEFEVFYLKYAWAQDVRVSFGGDEMIIPGVATILNRLMVDLDQYSQASFDSYRHDNTLNGLRGKGLNRGNSKETIGINGSPQLLQVNDQSNGDLYANASKGRRSIMEKSKIQADPRLNAIIVRDTPNKFPKYKKLIESLDLEPQMLEIEATIIDINSDKLKELGINWRWKNNDDDVLFGNGSNSDIRLDTGTQITPVGKGGVVSFVIGDNAKFIGRLKALESTGAVNIVSRPHVLTLSNVEAILDTSSTFYVRLEGREEVDLFNVSVGTSLRVTPHVFLDGDQERIKLLISIEDGQPTSNQVDNIPVVDRSTINTQALINAGESVLVGGMVREEKVDGSYKVPIIGDVPILGNLFKSNSQREARVERMFLISPRLTVQKIAGNITSKEIDSMADVKNKKIEDDRKQEPNSNNEKDLSGSWILDLDI